MNIFNLTVGAILTAFTLPSFALVGVYSGDQCYGMKFDFRKDGRIFLTEMTGRVSTGTYRQSGNMVSIDMLGNGPSLALTYRYDTVALQVPAMLGQPSHTALCTRPIDGKGPSINDPSLSGCWKMVKMETFFDKKSPAKESVLNCVKSYSENTFKQVCKVAGKPDATTAGRFVIKEDGVQTAEFTDVSWNKSMQGMRFILHYSVNGNLLRTEIFGEENMPDKPNMPWKSVSTFRKTEVGACE